MEIENEIRLVSSMDENELAYSLAATLNSIAGRMKFQEQSYSDIEKMIRDKAKNLTPVDIRRTLFGK